MGGRRNRASSKLAIFAIAILILGILGGKLFQFLGFLQKPFSEGIFSKREYSWDGKSSVNLAINYQGVNVLSYDPLAKKIVILKISDDTYFELPKGYGFWRAGSIYKLGQEEKPPKGAQLLRNSLSKLLGLPMDGFVSISDDFSKAPLDGLISSMHDNPARMLSLIRNVETDFTLPETINLLRSLSGVRTDKIIAVDLAQSNITSSKLLPDSSRVLGVDSVKLDLFVRNNMADSNIASEAVSVGIYNGTARQGIAGEVAREVTNMGGNVTFTSNTQESFEKSMIVTSSSTETAKRLKQIFAPLCLKEKCQTPDVKVNSSRADVNIILGEDF